MTPFRTIHPPNPATLARVSGIHAALGRAIRSARLRRRWTTERLAREAGVSRTLVYLVERGEPTSLETFVRLGAALRLRLEASLEDPRVRARPARAEDLVHAAIVELLAARSETHSSLVMVDEPFQHYQFAGRADLAAIDATGPDLLTTRSRARSRTSASWPEPGTRSAATSRRRSPSVTHSGKGSDRSRTC